MIVFLNKGLIRKVTNALERQSEVGFEEQENTGPQGQVSLTDFRGKRDAPINLVDDWLMVELVEGWLQFLGWREEGKVWLFNKYVSIKWDVSPATSFVWGWGGGTQVAERVERKGAVLENKAWETSRSKLINTLRTISSLNFRQRIHFNYYQVFRDLGFLLLLLFVC